MMEEGTGERRILKRSQYSTSEAGSEVTVGARPGKESTAPRVVHLDTPESRKFADAQSVEQDLAYAVDALSALLDDGQIPGGSLIARSLLVAALVAYARCFTTGVRRRYSLDVQRIEAMDAGAAAYHRWLLAVRNKYIAHSVNAYEQGIPGLLLSPPESGVRMILGCSFLRSEFVGLAKQDVEQAIRFVSQVRALVDDDLVGMEDAMLVAARALPIDEVYALPPPKLVTISPDQANQPRRA